MLDPSQRHPEDDQFVTPRTPGEYLKQEMSDRDLSAVSLSAMLGVHPQTIYNVTGKEPRKISSRLAVALAKHLGKDVDFWLAETLPKRSANPGTTGASRRPPSNSGPEITPSPRTSTSHFYPSLMVDWQLVRALADPDSGLEIRSPDETHVRSASIDLTVGKIVVRGYEYLKRDILTLISRYQMLPECLSATERENAEQAIEFYSKEIDIQDSYELKPGESVVIISREDLSFSEKFAGRVGQNTSLLLDGCQVIHGLQIDPGFSGPLFVRAVNLLKKENITLSAKDVLLSIEVTSLADVPRQSHQGALDRRIANVTENVHRVIGELFAYKSKADDIPYKATFKGDFEKSFVRKNDEDVKRMAVAWIVATLADASSVARPEVEAKVGEAMDSIPILRDEAEALMISAAVPMAEFEAVFRHFDDDFAQSLLDTIGWMDRKPADIAVALLGHDTAKERAWPV